jgi:hypothetical protein
MNIITTLKTDHGNVDALFKRFEATAADDLEALGTLRDHILEQLAIHAEIEEQTIYPALRGVGEDDVLESLEEHHALKLVLSELEKMAPDAERFRAKMQVVIDLVRHHVEEEEGDGGIFDLARKNLGPDEMEAMAEQAETLRAAGPTRPHPFSPDQPPWNLLVGVPVAVADRVITTARKIIDESLAKKG